MLPLASGSICTCTHTHTHAAVVERERVHMHVHTHAAVVERELGVRPTVCAAYVWDVHGVVRVVASLYVRRLGST